MDTTTLSIAALTLIHALVARLALRALVRTDPPRRPRRRRSALRATSTQAREQQLR